MMLYDKHADIFSLEFISTTMALLWVLFMVSFGTLVVVLLILRRVLRQRHNLAHAGKKDALSIAFFHPYCNAGGGGERVLWAAIQAIHTKYPHARCIVYTGDVEAKPEDILAKATHRFNIKLDGPVEFIYLKTRLLMEPYLYPYFTLLGQSFGSLFVGLEALFKFVPSIYVDTMGYAFTLPLFKYLGGCRVACYVHYPTISTDMLKKVAERTTAVNNARFISRSPVFSLFKVCYYKLFAALYGLVGRCSQVIMVNSSWTKSHIIQIWKSPNNTFCVFPPCDVSSFKDMPLKDGPKKNPRIIVSVGQFRPEKDHRLQIRSLRKFLDASNKDECNGVQLILIGGCRNAEDEERVSELKQMVCQLQLEDYVKFKLNVPFQELKETLQEATIGIHTMWNEHFGIGVVELMAAGVIVLSHDSGGPKMDIVVEHDGKPTGYLADTAEQYAVQINKIFSLTSEQQFEIRINAQKSVERFSDSNFKESFLSATQSLFQ